MEDDLSGTWEFDLTDFYNWETEQRIQTLLCAQWTVAPVIVSAGVRPYPE
jgi:hypothetical protein